MNQLVVLLNFGLIGAQIIPIVVRQNQLPFNVLSFRLVNYEQGKHNHVPLNIQV
jgi:hypothetical protein